MAWYRNHYKCYCCEEVWEDNWSCACDDECPRCGARNVSPFDSDDLTFIIDDEGGYFVVLRSPDQAEHEPDYEEVIVFLSKSFAELYIQVESSQSHLNPYLVSRL